MKDHNTALNMIRRVLDAKGYSHIKIQKERRRLLNHEAHRYDALIYFIMVNDKEIWLQTRDNYKRLIFRRPSTILREVEYHANHVRPFKPQKPVFSFYTNDRQAIYGGVEFPVNYDKSKGA